MSGGYTYGEKEPTEDCPYCGAVCMADFVDVGVGYTQCGPYHCSCGASEIGPYDKNTLSPEEKRIGWYGPNSEPGSSANVIDGRVVNHRQMEDAYRQQFIGNPRYYEQGVVADWFEETRKAK